MTPPAPVPLTERVSSSPSSPYIISYHITSHHIKSRKNKNGLLLLRRPRVLACRQAQVRHDRRRRRRPQESTTIAIVASALHETPARHRQEQVLGGSHARVDAVTAPRHVILYVTRYVHSTTTAVLRQYTRLCVCGATDWREAGPLAKHHRTCPDAMSASRLLLLWLGTELPPAKPGRAEEGRGASCRVSKEKKEKAPRDITCIYLFLHRASNDLLCSFLDGVVSSQGFIHPVFPLVHAFLNFFHRALIGSELPQLGDTHRHFLTYSHAIGGPFRNGRG